jgi:hypothetical protein
MEQYSMDIIEFIFCADGASMSIRLPREIIVKEELLVDVDELYWVEGPWPGKLGSGVASSRRGLAGGRDGELAPGWN